MKSEQCTSAANQVCRAQKSKGGSPKGSGKRKRQGLKSDMSAGMSDYSKKQINGYKMGQGTGKGNI